LLVLIVIGVVTGIAVSLTKSHKSSSSSGSSPASSAGPSSSLQFTKGKSANPTTGYFDVVPWSNENDPSTFEKDSNLQNAFWGVAYTPFGSIIPSCGSNLREYNLTLFFLLSNESE
jgi:hypothetical protein